MRTQFVVVNIIGRDQFVAPLVEETTSGYVVKMSREKDSFATEWFPKESKGCRCGILKQEELG